MYRNIRKSLRHVIHSTHFLWHMKDWMFFSESNCFLYKSGKILLLLRIFPVRPSYCIILTPCIVVSHLWIGKFITTIDHWRPLTQKQHQKRIPHLLLTHFANCLFACCSLNATVPGIIKFTAITVVLAIRFVMAIIICHCIIQRKPILICHIIDSSKRARIPSHMKFCPWDHTFITLKKSSHILLKSCIIFCKHIFRICIARDLRKHFLCPIKNRILFKDFLMNAISHKMKSIHMIKQFPHPEGTHYLQWRRILREIHLHDTLDSCLMQCMDHITKLPIRFPGRTVRCFRRKIKSLCISPVIYPVIFFWTDCHTARRLFACTFLKLICRHQFNCIDSHLFPIRNHLHKSCKSTFFSRRKFRLLCVSTYMNFV